MIKFENVYINVIMHGDDSCLRIEDLKSKDTVCKKKIKHKCSMWIENSVTQDHCFASLSKADSKQLPSVGNMSTNDRSSKTVVPKPT